MKELWKDFRILDKNYYVSNWGRVRVNEQILQSYRMHLGYKMVVLENYHVGLHILVVEQFSPTYGHNRPVLHANGDLSDNRIDNLQVVTQKLERKYKLNPRKRPQLERCIAYRDYQRIINTQQMLLEQIKAQHYKDSKIIIDETDKSCPF